MKFCPQQHFLTDLLDLLSRQTPPQGRFTFYQSLHYSLVPPTASLSRSASKMQRFMSSLVERDCEIINLDAAFLEPCAMLLRKNVVLGRANHSRALRTCDIDVAFFKGLSYG
jgi:hypothetical protein